MRRPLLRPRVPDVARPSARASRLLAAARLAALAFVTLACFVAYWFDRVVVLRPPDERARLGPTWTHRWAACAVRILGWRVRVLGDAPRGAALLAPNHLGYADILLLGAILPCYFVAKRDVFSWPVLGRLLRMLGHPAIDRTSRAAVARSGSAIGACLATRQPVCVFLEGTSTGGDRVLPFRPSLLQAAIDEEARVVPVALRWRARRPNVRVEEDIAYWTPEHAFGPHFWRLAGLVGIEAEVRFAACFDAAGGDRKELATRARAAVAAHLGLSPGQEGAGAGEGGPDWEPGGVEAA